MDGASLVEPCLAQLLLMHFQLSVSGLEGVHDAEAYNNTDGVTAGHDNSLSYDLWRQLQSYVQAALIKQPSASLHLDHSALPLTATAGLAEQHWKGLHPCSMAASAAAIGLALRVMIIRGRQQQQWSLSIRQGCQCVTLTTLLVSMSIVI